MNSRGNEITNRSSPPRPRPGGRPGANRQRRSLRLLRVCSSRRQSEVRVHDHRERPCWSLVEISPKTVEKLLSEANLRAGISALSGRARNVGTASSHNFPLTCTRCSSISDSFIHLTSNGMDILRMIQRSETVSVEVAQVPPAASQRQAGGAETDLIDGAGFGGLERVQATSHTRLVSFPHSRMR